MAATVNMNGKEKSLENIGNINTVAWELYHEHSSHTYMRRIFFTRYIFVLLKINTHHFACSAFNI